LHVKVDGGTKELPALWLEGGAVNFIDQRKLPHSLEIFRARTVEEVAAAIRDMVVRGAPAIGCAAAYGMALAMKQGEDSKKAAALLGGTRPTAHDLFFAINWMIEMAPSVGPLEASEQYVQGIVEGCRRIGENGARLIRDGDTILTHCNAGALATVDYGTALAPMRIAREEGKDFFVYVDETRPWLQGSRLTAWELSNEAIPHAIIADNAAGYFLRKEVDLVLVGADRIARNGDFANKIGTYEKAVVARANDVRFYVAAPLSTFDSGIGRGEEIRIEERAEEEITSFMGMKVAERGERARNPVFDITPAEYVDGYITEEGIFSADHISQLMERERHRP